MGELIRDYSYQVRKETDLDDFIFAVDHPEEEESCGKPEGHGPQ